jgi:flagellar biosynthesis protein FliP
MIALLTVLSLAPSILVMMTSFTRIERAATHSVVVPAKAGTQ